MKEKQPDSLSNGSAISNKIRLFNEDPKVQYFIISLIILSAILLGLETWPPAMNYMGTLIRNIDRLIIGIFVLEICLRIYVEPKNFWKDPWSLFDFIVVSISLIPASGPLAVLRALRVLRVLRLLTIVPSMRRVVGALLGAIPGLTSIALVLLIIYYVFAVIATNLFASHYPEWFGNIGNSLYTLFQIMTLESWSMGIARPVMQDFPYAWTFFIPFILIATFTMLNLFIAIIIDAMQAFSVKEHKDTVAVVTQSRDHIEADLHAELKALRVEIGDIKRMLMDKSEN